MNALPKTLLLGLCIALAACQSTQPDTPAKSARLNISEPLLAGLEYAQLLNGDTPWAGADRVQVDDQGLQLLDAAGNSLARHAGRFEGLDHRVDRQGLLLATVERKR